MRRKSKRVQIGNIAIGGNERVAIQSMLSARADDTEINLLQAKALEEADCDIVRVAIPTMESVNLIYALKNTVLMPVVADIHFDYKLALECVEAGVDKIRINPGNIGSDDRVKAVALACKAKEIPIRIGVNSGSVERHILEKHGRATPAAMVESALYHAALLEKFDFNDIVISIKSQDVPSMMAAYRLMAGACEYPLHLGVTHTGTARIGVIKSAIGIGGLLVEGIGDTLRVSLSDTPASEIRAAKDILMAVGQSRGGVEIISCPTCGRKTIDVIGLAHRVEEALAGCKHPLTIAVMGCVVNGPGEAKEADLGVTGADGIGILFAKGKLLRKVPETEILPALLAEVDKLLRERYGEN